MGAGRFVDEAKSTNGMSGPGNRFKRSKSLSRFNRCSCHPQQWGLKKGLRRGRRRGDKEIIEEEVIALTNEKYDEDTGYKMDLRDIGFYTLSDNRCKNSSEHSTMKRCEMVITEYCNFNCRYCRGINPIVWEGSKLKQMSLDAIKRGIDYWCQDGPVENIRFSGGEPTLHKDIREVIRYTASKGIKRIAISTNGSNDIALYRELVELGANDFSISLDGCCAEDVDFMAGGVKGAFEKVANSIRELSKLTYVTVGVVLTPDNIQRMIDTIMFADSLGVSDIRIIPSAQWNKKLDELDGIPQKILDKYPILKYRVQNFMNGLHVRGMHEGDSPMCGIALDDSVIAGGWHFPCIISLREGIAPIGKVGPNMRQERKEWMLTHNCLNDPICRGSCLDCIVQYNNKFAKWHPEFSNE